MGADRPLHRITLEFLRAGPPHNQLLSPLTPYLAICGEAAGAVVHVPWEHARLTRRLEELRYEHGTEDDPARRIALMNEMGEDIARLLGSIPAVAGALTVDPDPERRDLTHFRVVLSASELGLIPFELAKVPGGLTVPSETWLQLQSGVPVCITRRVRSVSSEGVAWTRRPRLLFLASDPDDIPFERNLDALVDAVRPWLPPEEEEPIADPDDPNVTRYGDVLTVVPDATLEVVQRLCRAEEFTHIHVLAHGAEDATADRLAYGIGLGGDVVPGSRFATAVFRGAQRGVGGPSVVTLACCDSANIGSVVTAGASFAHALHQAGVPLVVASQFPLSFDGSVTLVRWLYGHEDGLLWGRHPVAALHELRRALLVAHEAHSHDWASIVAYEALPSDLDTQLEAFAYRQARAALKAGERGLKAVERRIGDTPLGELDEMVRVARSRCETALERLPAEGAYALEALGIAGSHAKVVAETEFRLSQKPRLPKADREVRQHRCLLALEHAWDAYSRAVLRYVSGVDAGQQLEAQLHWVVTQVLSLGTVLGKDLDEDLWGAGQLSAGGCLVAMPPRERAWAHGSMAELALLAIAHGRTVDDPHAPAGAENRVLDHVGRLAALFPERGAAPVTSTYRQFRRYADWWLSPTFREYVNEHNGPTVWTDQGRLRKTREVTRKALTALSRKMWKQDLEV